MIVYALIAVIAINRKNIIKAYQRHLAWEAEQEKQKKLQKKKKRKFRYQDPFQPEEQVQLPLDDSGLQSLIPAVDFSAANSEGPDVPGEQGQTPDESGK